MPNFMLVKLEAGSLPALADLTGLIGGIKDAIAFIWTIFTDMINTIATNPLLLWSVGFAIAGGVVAIGYKVVKKFGLKGRR